MPLTAPLPPNRENGQPNPAGDMNLAVAAIREIRAAIAALTTTVTELGGNVANPTAPTSTAYTLSTTPAYFNDFTTTPLGPDWSATGAELRTFGGQLGTNATGTSPTAIFVPDLPGDDMAIRARVTRSTQRGSVSLRVRVNTSTASNTGVYAKLLFDATEWQVGQFVGGTDTPVGTVPAGVDGEMVTLAVLGTRAFLKVGTADTVGFDVAAPSGTTNRHVSLTVGTASPQWLLDDLGVHTTAAVGAAPAEVRRTDYGSYRPDASTAGVYGTLTPQAGDLIVTTAGQVVEGLDIAGRVQIKANNVIVRRCRVRMEGLPSTFKGAGIYAAANEQSGAIIEDCTVAPTNPRVSLDGIQVGGNVTVRRCDVSGTVDGLKVAGDGCSLLGNHVHDLKVYATDPDQSNGSHSDAVQFQGGASTTLRGNSLRGVITTINQACQGIIVTQDVAVVAGLTVDRNWIDGGYTPSNFADKGKGAMSGVKLTSNVYGGNQTNGDNVHNIMSAATFAAATITGNVVTGGATYKTYQTAT